MSKVGVVGLGAMGSRIAGRLLNAGFDVHGTNHNMTKARPLIDRGLAWEATPRDVAAAADVLISLVADEDALAGITTGRDGILAGLAPGKIYVDMSTVSPDASVRLAERVGLVGASMLDAPVSGNLRQAAAGTLTVLVGGQDHVARRAMPVLRTLGTVTRVGDNGHGVLLKLAINISLAAQTLAFCEGLMLARRGGIDPRLAAQLMATSLIGSPMLRRRMPLILDLPERSWFDIDLLQNHIRLALEAAIGLAVPLPSAATADVLLTKARELGYGRHDIAALHEVLDQLAGTAEPSVTGRANGWHCDG
jgi:3-hydroxyisobutyrate dehydrogenase-like beta-hydroxyacid dehydrogenase